MAKYKSKFPELGFYVDGERRKFQYGEYETKDKREIEVLDSLRYVERVDEQPKAEKQSEEKPAEEKPKKATAKRKSSAK